MLTMASMCVTFPEPPETSSSTLKVGGQFGYLQNAYWVADIIFFNGLYESEILKLSLGKMSLLKTEYSHIAE